MSFKTMASQTKYSNKLGGTKILVIGGSSGIGLAVAEAAVEFGAKVFIASSTQGRVTAAVEQIQTSYPAFKQNVTGILADLSNFEKLDDDVVTLFEKVGTGIDHIIYTAGPSIKMLPFNSITPHDLLEGSTVRLYGPIFISKHAPKYMNPGPRSSITFTTGNNSERPVPGMEIWSTVSSAVKGAAKGLALALAPIRVNSVHLGLVETPLVAGYLAMGRKTFADQTLTGKVGQPEDAAEAYLYLMRDENTTGSHVFSESGSLLR